MIVAMFLKQLPIQILVADSVVISNKNIIMSSFKSSGNIQKNESGPYRGFAYWMLISDPITPGKNSQSNLLKFNEIVTGQSTQRPI